MPLEKTQSESLLKDISLPKYNCSNLIYDKFIKTYVYKDYSLVGGKEQWLKILEEYSTMLHTDKADTIFECWKKIIYNEYRLVVVDVSTTILRDLYVIEAADALVEAGFGFVDNLEDDKDYQRQIDFVIKEAGTLVVVLNSLYVEYDKLCPTGPGNLPKERTEMDFDKDLAVLSKHGYRIKKRKQTVTEYCAAVNAFMDEVKAQKNGNKRSTI